MKFSKRLGIMQGRLSNNNINKVSSYPINPVSEIKKAAELNFVHLEFITKESYYFHKKNLIWDDKNIYILKKITSDNKIKKVVFTDNRSVKTNFLKLDNYYKQLIKQISKFKFKFFIVPLINKSEFNFKKIHQSVKFLDNIINYCKKRKIMFLVETNMNFANYKKLEKEMKNKLNIVYDTGNRQYNNSQIYLEEIILFQNRIKHIHLKDRDKKGNNVKFGNGNVNFKEVFKKLNQIKYKGLFTLESSRGSDSIKTQYMNYQYIKKCLRKINH